MREIRELIAEGDIDKCLARLRDCLDAKIYVRGPKKKDGPFAGKTLTYVEVADRATQLTAIKIFLAYKYGAPPTHSEIVVHNQPGDGPKTLQPAEQMRELAESGADLKKIFESWLSVMPNVTGTGENAQEAAKAEVLEV